MPKDIDFSRLRLQDALDLAILIEEEAEERYLEFAEQMETFHTPDAAHFFRFMAGNESRHGQELRHRRQARFGGQPAAVDRDMLWDVEAPTYDRARAFMSARRALQVALESEIKAHDFFARALPGLQDLEVKKLFEELRDEEVEHQALVREQLEKQPPDDGIDPEAFADEPGGQEM
jgi:rubrerythrin